MKLLRYLVAIPLPTPTIFSPSADTSNMAADLTLLQNTVFNNSGPTARLCVTPLALLYSSPDRNPAGIFPFLQSILSLFRSSPSWVSSVPVQNLPLSPPVSFVLSPLCCSLLLSQSSLLNPPLLGHFLSIFSESPQISNIKTLTAVNAAAWNLAQEYNRKPAPRKEVKNCSSVNLNRFSLNTVVLLLAIG